MSTWTTEGTQICKDGKPAFLAGVCYAPTPIGAATFTPGIGDWFTPPWNGIWERDFPLMQAAGINNIRTYFFWAWTPPENMANWKQVVAQPPTFDHTAFLDAAQASGISVTIGIALDGGNIFDNGSKTLGEDYFQFYLHTAKKLAELYGNHPAVMGFCLGNEQNNQGRIVRASFWDILESMSTAVKTAAPNKLVMFAMQNDNPNMFTATITQSGKTVPQRFAQIFDVWGINIYAGMSGTLANYKQYVAAQTDTALPLIVSEWGVPGGITDNTLPPPPNPPVPAGVPSGRQLTAKEFSEVISSTMTNDWNAIAANLAFVSGSQWFEWTDEWWKNNWWETTKPVTTPYIQVGSKDVAWPEDWWGLNAIAPNGHPANSGPWDNPQNKPYPPDLLTPRPTLTALTGFYKGLPAG
jgi:hypothetical protein